MGHASQGGSRHQSSFIGRMPSLSIPIVSMTETMNV
jgi:hypothetical protein